MNLILFLSFCEIINLFLSSVFCVNNLFAYDISIMSFYYSQFHFLINDDILGVYFSLSITKNDATNTYKKYLF